MGAKDLTAQLDNNGFFRAEFRGRLFTPDDVDHGWI